MVAAADCRQLLNFFAFASHRFSRAAKKQKNDRASTPEETYRVLRSDQPEGTRSRSFNPKHHGFALAPLKFSRATQSDHYI